MAYVYKITSSHLNNSFVSSLTLFEQFFKSFSRRADFKKKYKDKKDDIRWTSFFSSDFVTQIRTVEFLEEYKTVWQRRDKNFPFKYI